MYYDLDELSNDLSDLDVQPDWPLPEPPPPVDGCPDVQVAVDDRARHHLLAFWAEFARLGAAGIPVGHTSSAVLVPIIWLTLTPSWQRLLCPELVALVVDLLPLRQLAAFWQQQGVGCPNQRVQWNRASL
ncbi:MAG: hypothetical protein ACKPKO_51535, partial [Candidatus Fonsibacter sp.]